MAGNQSIQRFLDECLAIRQVIQEEQSLTGADRAKLRSHLEDLLESLEANFKRGKGKP
jgi:hypothetical protein